MFGWLRKTPQRRNPSHSEISQSFAPLIATAIEQIIDQNGIDFLLDGCFCVTGSAEIQFAQGPITGVALTQLQNDYVAVATIKSRKEALFLKRVHSTPHLGAYKRVEVDMLAVALSDTIAAQVVDRFR